MNSVTEIVWKDIEKRPELEIIIEKVIQKVVDSCFKHENLDKLKLYISITLTIPDVIKSLNKQYRNIDKETDVLSFPMFERNELDQMIEQNSDSCIEEGILQDIMGDIIISIDRVEEQANEYGHGFDREFAYMLVHGFYHLRGYDHMTDDEKKEMREKEENVLSQLNITR